MPLSFTSIALIKAFDNDDITSDFRPYDLAAADFNQDNKLDITSDRHVFLGDGTGKFQEVAQSEMVRTALGPVTQRIPTDLNQDGRTDLVALTPTGVTVLLGDGSGSFSSTQSFVAGTRPVALAIADFNQDNIPDVITTNSGRLKDRSTQNLSILLGRSDGTLKAAKSLKVPGKPLNSVVGDFNGDGKRDIVVLNKRGQTQLTVLLGNGKGRFQLTRSIKLDRFTDRIVSGDFNRDRKTDVAVADSQTLSILFGTRQGELKLHDRFEDPFALEDSYANLIKGDFNGDGLVDLATASGFYGRTSVSVLQGNGQGDFSRAASFSASVNEEHSEMSNGYDIVHGDFNGDGKLDLATADGSSYYEGRITTFLNTTKKQSNRSGSGNDVITGSNGNDQLIGGTGEDQLTGENGRDRFIFSNTPNYPEGLNRMFERSRMGVDQVVDFQPGEDKIILDGGTFTALKQKIQFALVKDELAAQTNQAILTYVRKTGKLYYNPNGSQSGFGNGGLFAEFSNQADLSAKDFSVFL